MKKITLILLSLLSFVCVYAQDYCKVEGSRTNSDRLLKKFQIVGGTLNGEAQNFVSTFATGDNKKIYHDRTSEVIEVSQGDELTLTINHSYIWMNFYGYIDYNQDKVFTVDGEMIFDLPCPGGSIAPVPTIKIPLDAPLGTTRFRFKSEWSSTDPCGNAQGMSNDRGIMVDYTIKINPHKEASTITINESIINGTVTLATSEGPVNSGGSVAVGSVVTVNAIPNVGYKLSKIMVNGVAIEGNTFTVGLSDVIVTVVFVQNESDALTLTASHGTISAVAIGKDNVETPVNSGDNVPNGNLVKLTFVPEAQYALGNLTLKGIDVTAGVVDNAYTFTMNGASTVVATFKPSSLTYCVPAESNSPGTILTHSYLKAVTSTGGLTNLNFTATSRAFLVNAGTISATAGETITVKLKANSLGDYSTSAVRQDLRYTTAAIFIDWNQDGDFEYSKRIAGKFIGEGMDNIGGNFDVLDITHEIAIPASATGKARVRVVYHNAWESTILSKACGPIKEGAVCDFDLDVKSTNLAVTIAQPLLKIGSFKLMNGEVEVINGTLVAPGTVLTVVPTFTSDKYKLHNVLVNGAPVDGTEVTVTENMKISLDIWNQFAVGTISHGTVAAVAVDANNVETPIVSEDYLANGTNVKVTFTPEDHYLFGTILLNGTNISADVKNGVYHFVMNDTVVINATFPLDPQYVTYCTPTEEGATAAVKDTYVKAITSTGGNTDLNYSATSRTFYTHVGTISAIEGQTVKVNFVANSLGESSTTVVRQDIRYTAAALFIDWNKDGDFTANESERVAGKLSGEAGFHNVTGNMDALNITKDINIPLGTRGKIRARIIYNNAWMGNPLTKACGPIKEGVVYDFDLDVDAAIYTIGITQPEAGFGTFKVMNGTVDIQDGAEITTSGTVLTVVPTLPSDEYEVRSVLVNGTPIEGFEILVKDDIMISLDVIKGRSITYSSTGNGSLTVTGSSGSIENNGVVLKGSNVTIKAVPAKGSHIVSVMVDGEDKTAECTSATGLAVVVNADLDVKATFAIDTHKVTYSYNADLGKISVTDNGVNVASESMVEYGKTLVVTLNPANDQCFIKAVKIDGVDKTDELLPDGKKIFNLLIEEDVNIEVIFDAVKYHLACNTPDFGTMVIKDGSNRVYANGDEVAVGTTLSLTLTAIGTLTKLLINDGIEEIDYVAEGYVDVDGKVYTTDLTAAGDVSIEATFSDATGIEDISAESVKVYLNDDRNAVVEGVQAGNSIKVYDVAGRMISEQVVVSSKETIVLPQYSAIYMIQITDGINFVAKKLAK